MVKPPYLGLFVVVATAVGRVLILIAVSISVGIMVYFNFLSDLYLTLVSGSYLENFLFILDSPILWSISF